MLIDGPDPVRFRVEEAELGRTVIRQIGQPFK
ncbi:hypothetical protein EMGBS8_13270 [Verrucomicrobiota bacterium]|nr:hypothetical protein EMGBS8_13270 [Verrucomicrobiota bacterium]